ncbi:MAG: DEAD/DEAH box helicase [Candidatus Komeilibacteria bacterium]|nr:DEAD/DEAH box helicase [Candidatus Komeilibacteria bacterium]
MNQEPQTTAVGFSGLGIAPSLLEALAKLKISSPTPIQKQAIPIAIQGKDVMGVAQTGTGKTFAFGIPMIQRLHQLKGRGLIVLPTRELATQVDEALRQLGHGLGLKTAVLIGGTSAYPQIKALARNPHIIIGTPGRLNDHLNQKTLRTDDIKVVVLDEADRMLDMGFAPQIRQIFQNLPHDRQTMLFSATMPSEIIKLASSYMKLPIRIEVAPTGTTADRVTQEIFICPKDAKIPLTEKLLKQYTGPTLIFTKTKYGAKRLSQLVRQLGHSCVELHSNRSLGQRQDAMKGFKSGKYRILIATDIASRGIDVVGIELVLNFDLPMNTEDYVHRIGRTARAGAGGHAISLVTPEQRYELREIERLVKTALPISKLPDLPNVKITAEDDKRMSGRPRSTYNSRRSFRKRY